MLEIKIDTSTYSHAKTLFIESDEETAEKLRERFILFVKRSYPDVIYEPCLCMDCSGKSKAGSIYENAADKHTIKSPLFSIVETKIREHCTAKNSLMIEADDKRPEIESLLEKFTKER